MGSGVPEVVFEPPPLPEAEAHVKDNDGKDSIISTRDMRALSEENGARLPSIGDTYSLYCPRLIAHTPLTIIVAASNDGENNPPKSLQISGSYRLATSPELIKVDRTVNVRD
jgi:hypothetical protein